MARSKGVSASSSSSRNRLCGCGEMVLTLTSKSAKNPGRRFFRCPNWKQYGGCNYFEWVEDELSAVDASEVTKCVCFRSAESGVEAAKLKVGKLQNKLARERKKMTLFLSLLLVMSWAVILVGGYLCVTKCHCND
ncbi:Zinc finger, GRF-type [Sesbania bispinosa]|nr:Zinc finger, GRF-type [Sesbania bispinosa]